MSESRHILCPIDFSDRAIDFLPYTGNIARNFESDITLLHVLSYEGIYPGPEEGVFDIRNLQDQRRKQTETELIRLSARALTGLNVIAVVERGDAAQSIARRVKDHNIGLIVLATHGRGIFRRLLLGSVTSKVLHDNACPVWTTAHSELPAAHHSTEIKSIVCAIDSSEDACHVLVAAVDLELVYGATIRLVHAIPVQQDVTLNQFLADTALDKIQKMQQAEGTKWDLHVEFGVVANVMRDAAVRYAADLIVVGRGKLTEPLGGLRTHVESIIREVPCAVLSV